MKLAFSVDGATTIGGLGPENIRTLERDAELANGHLNDFAFHIATNLQSTLTQVIDTLPDSLQAIPAVELYPYATFAQTLRVRDLLSDGA